jgi:V/A-type H+-transporting ATPase subunit E
VAYEGREAREAAAREAARIREEARAAASAAAEETLRRARDEAERTRRAAEERRARDRERALLVERRAQLDALRAEALAAARVAGSPALDAALLAEVLPEAGPGSVEVVVDPGAEEAARAALAVLDPDAAARAVVRGADAPRGGVLLVAGRRVLDDTLPSRLERAWPALEPALVAILEEG